MPRRSLVTPAKAGAHGPHRSASEGCQGIDPAERARLCDRGTPTRPVQTIVDFLTTAAPGGGSGWKVFLCDSARRGRRRNSLFIRCHSPGSHRTSHRRDKLGPRRVRPAEFVKHPQIPAQNDPTGLPAPRGRRRGQLGRRVGSAAPGRRPVDVGSPDRPLRRPRPPTDWWRASLRARDCRSYSRDRCAMTPAKHGPSGRRSLPSA